MSRIALYMGLIESVLAHNTDIMNEERIEDILKKLRGPHPVFKKVEIYRDLTLHSGAVGYADIPDKESTMAALRAVLEEYYVSLSNYVGISEARDRIREPVKEYMSARWNEVVSTHIDKYLPNLTLLDIKNKMEDISAMSRGERGRVFFETIFTSYATDLSQTITVSTYKKKLSTMKKDILVARGVKLMDNGVVEIMLPVEDPGIVDGLCQVFNSFVDLAAFTLGEEGALEKAQYLIAPIVKLFSPLPEEIGAVRRLIHGRLSQYLPCSIPGFEQALGGGFRRATTYLFQVPSGIERNILWSHILKDVLLLRGSSLAVVSTRFPTDVRQDMASVGLKLQKYESKSKMVFVDWYSYKSERIVGMDVSGSVVKSGKDLTNLEIALEKGLDIISGQRVARINLDSVSPMIKGFDSKSVYSFFQSLKKRASEKHLVVVAFVEKEMHDPKTLSWLHQVFDGTIDISKSEDNFVFRVLSLRGRSLKPMSYSLDMSMGSISLDIKPPKKLKDEEIVALIEEGERKRAASAVTSEKKSAKREMRKDAPSTKAMSKEDHYKLGVELASKKDYSNAKKEFLSALKMDDKFLDAYQALGAMSLYGSSDLDGAIEALKKVVELDPENGDAWFDIGNAFYKKNMFFEAKQAILSALEVKPYYRWYNSKEFLCPSCNTILSIGTRRCSGCGVKLDTTGRIIDVEDEGSISSSTKSSSIKDSTQSESDLDAGMSFDDELEEIEPQLESTFVCPVCSTAVRESDKKCPGCGALFEDEEETSLDMEDMSKEDGKEASASNDDDPITMLKEELGDKLINGEWEDAILLMDTIIEAEGPSPEIVLRKGVALTNSGMPKDALVLYKDYLKQNPSEKHFLGAISFALFTMKKYPQAMKYADACLKYLPDDAMAKKVKNDVQDITEEGG